MLSYSRYGRPVGRVKCFFRNNTLPPPPLPGLRYISNTAREKLKARLPVLIGVLPSLAGRGGIACTFMEVAKGMAYRLAARTVQLLATVDLNCWDQRHGIISWYRKTK